MIARATFTRIRVSAVQARFLSTQGETALRKFQQVMQEYRIAKYVPPTDEGNDPQTFV